MGKEGEIMEERKIAVETAEIMTSADSCDIECDYLYPEMSYCCLFNEKLELINRFERCEECLNADVIDSRVIE